MSNDRSSAPSVAVIAWLPVLAAATAFSLTGSVLWSRRGADVSGTALHAAAFAAGYAVLIGAPAAHWAIASGRRGLFQWIGFGAAAGLILVGVPLTGHLIGALVRGEMTVFRLTWGVLVRLILDAVGVGDLWRARRSLVLIELWPVLCGGVTGAIYWLLIVKPAGPRDRF